MRKLLVAILCIISCVNLIACEGYKDETIKGKETHNVTKSIPYETLRREDIQNISIFIDTQQVNDTLSENEIVQFIEYISQLEIHEQVLPETLVGQMVNFHIEKVDKSVIELKVAAPYVIIDDIWYKGDGETCERLNQFANDLK